MSETKPGTVKETGASAGDYLIDAEDFNKGLRIRVHEKQEPGHGGRVSGAFELENAGVGRYAHLLKDSENESFGEAAELLDPIAQAADVRVTHILNCNALKVDDSALE